MVQDVDFLPVSYRHERERGRKKISRRVVLVVFLALIVAGTHQQRKRQTSLQAQRDRMQNQATQMLSQLEDPDALRAQTHQLEVQARLLTLLRARVPPTRILTAIANGLPKYVSLTSCHVTQATSKERVPQKLASPKPDAASGSKTPEEQDLQTLCDARDQSFVHVQLEGLAPDDLAVSSCLAALQATNLFDEVQLIYSDTQEYAETTLRSFEIHLRLRQFDDVPDLERAAAIARVPSEASKTGSDGGAT